MITADSLIPRGVSRLPAAFNSQKTALWTDQQIIPSSALLGPDVGLLGESERTCLTSIPDLYRVSACPPFRASNWLVRSARHRS